MFGDGQDLRRRLRFAVLPCVDGAGADLDAELVTECSGEFLVAEAGVAPEYLECVPAVR